MPYRFKAFFSWSGVSAITGSFFFLTLYYKRLKYWDLRSKQIDHFWRNMARKSENGVYWGQICWFDWPIHVKRWKTWEKHGKSTVCIFWHGYFLKMMSERSILAPFIQICGRKEIISSLPSHWKQFDNHQEPNSLKCSRKGFIYLILPPKEWIYSILTVILREIFFLNIQNWYIETF